MNKAKIEWCDSTWNPVTGCLHGCEYCYARRIAERFSNQIQTESNIHEVDKAIYTEYEIFQNTKAPYPFGFEPTFHRYRLDDFKGKTKPKTIFVCSMADLFGEWVPDEWIQEVFKACEAAPQHRYLFLTKNPDRYLKLDNLPWNKNIWFGSTIAGGSKNKNIIEGFNNFVSIEPLLSLPMNYEKWIPMLNWVIIGAETGNRKDKVIPKLEWIKEIVQECDFGSVPVFMKNSLVPIVGEENMRREFPWKS